MTLKPERQLVETVIHCSLREASGNAGAAVYYVGDDKVALAMDTPRGAIAGVLLQDVRPFDYTTRSQRLCDSTAVSGDKVGIMSKGIIITDMFSAVGGAAIVVWRSGFWGGWQSCYVCEYAYDKVSGVETTVENPLQDWKNYIHFWLAWHARLRKSGRLIANRIQ